MCKSNEQPVTGPLTQARRDLYATETACEGSGVLRCHPAQFNALDGDVFQKPAFAPGCAGA